MRTGIKTLVAATAMGILAAWQIVPAAAQEGAPVDQECVENVSAPHGTVVFRYKTTALSGCGETVPEEEDEEDGEEIPFGGADFYPDVESAYIYGSAPVPLQLHSTEKRVVPDENGLTWQCFRATGGYGNYFWIVDRGEGAGDFSWLDGWDVVTRENLDDPMPSSSYSWGYVAPAHEESQARFPVDMAGEACVRVKANPDETATDHAYIELKIEDMGSGQVSGGYMSEDSFYGASSYGGHTVIVCQNGCEFTPPEYGITGPSSIEMIVGVEMEFPWQAEYGAFPYSYDIVVDPASMITLSEGYLLGMRIGVYDMTVRAVDDSGAMAQMDVEVEVVPAPVLEIYGDVDEIEVGMHSWFWDAEGGAWPYTWEMTSPSPALKQGDDGWGGVTLNAYQPGVYEDVEVKVTDSGGQTAFWTGTITVTTGESGTYAWGDNTVRQYGNYSNYSSMEPMDVYHSRVWDVLAAGRQGCGIEDGELYCWGSISWGYHGLGAGVGQQGPETAVSPSGGWSHVSTGDSETVCGIRNGDLYCWGGNSRYIVGTGSSSTSTVTTPHLVDAGGWTDVDVGTNHACGVQSGDLYCWGTNHYYGMIGNDSTSPVYSPVRVGLPGGWDTVTVGARHACAVRSGDLYCWGANDHGQLGIDSTADRSTTPVQVVPSASDWISAAAGTNYTCAIRGEGSLWCWGTNDWGMVGNSSPGGPDVRSPVRLEGNDWTLIDASEWHACGLRGEGALYCWGRSWMGRTGVAPGYGDTAAPTRVQPDYLWTTVTTGNAYTMGIGYQGSWSPDDSDRDEEFDHGREECGLGGDGNPVCEDDSPPSDDPVWESVGEEDGPGGGDGEGNPSDNPWDYWVESGVASGFARYDGLAGTLMNYPQMTHELRSTAWSSRAMFEGHPFSYYCFRVYDGWHDRWRYNIHIGDQWLVDEPVWLEHLDIVPRGQLFGSYPAVYHEDDWEPRHWPRPGGAYWLPTTTEKEMCVRWVSSRLRPQPNGDVLSSYPLTIYTTNGNPHSDSTVFDYTRQIWAIIVGPSH